MLGGAVVRVHNKRPLLGTERFVELHLMAVSSQNQTRGLGRRMLDLLKEKYETIVTFADHRALGFYEKMGFKEIKEDSKDGKALLSMVQPCDQATLMAFTSNQQHFLCRKMDSSIVVRQSVAESYVEKFKDKVFQSLSSVRSAEHEDKCVFPQVMGEFFCKNSRSSK